jgi:amino acid adenylation domain-containing protein
VTARVEGYQLSGQQERSWALRRGGFEGHVQAVIGLAGPVRQDRLRAAAALVLERHEILRSVFRRLPGMAGAVQLPVAAPAPPWSTVDTGPSGRRGELAAVVAGERAIPPAGDRLLRLTLVRGTGRPALVVTAHPLVADATTGAVIADDLAAAYADPGAYAAGSQDVVQYSQYAGWQRETAAEHGPDPAGSADTSGRIGWPLPGGYGPAGPDERCTVDLPDGERDAVLGWAAEHQVDSRIPLLAAWLVLAGRISGAPGPVVGTALPGRTLDELTGGAGPYDRWAGLRAAGPTWRALVADLSTRRELAAKEERSAAGLADDLAGWSFGFEFLADRPRPLPAGGSLAITGLDVRTEPCDVTLCCLATPGRLRLSWLGAPGHASADYLARLAEQHRVLLADALAQPDRPLGELTAVGPREQAELRARTRPAAPPACAHELIERQARRTPGAIAVRDGDAELTYAELDRRAGLLADRLRRHGAGPEIPVAVQLEHGADLVVGLLAVLKSGGAYVPLDPGLPERRVAGLLGRLSSRLLLTAAPAGPGGWRGTVVPVTAEDPPGAVPGDRPEVTPDGLAYVMFTSGSTGTPKGVLVPHSALSNYLLWSAGQYDAGRGGSIVHSPIGFDLTVTGLLTPLVAGGTVTMVDRRDPRAAAVALRRGRAELLKLTPSHLTLLGAELTPGELPGAVGTLVVGGEQLTADAVAPWLAAGARVFNEYGPTETVVGCTVHEIDGTGAGAVPIGRPIAGTRAYVLDDAMRPVPVGVPGELYIGGTGVTRGYAGAPGLTAGSFLPDPYSPVPGARVYRTGDLACRRPDGELQFLGRADEQIKVGGIRVEPAEVRAALREHPAVRDAAVVLRRDGGTERLAGYLIGARAPAADLRDFLRARLPEHLVPTAFGWLDALPLTANGKLDEAALPVPEPAEPVRTRPAAPPRDDVERRLAALVAGLLGLDVGEVGAEDGFFALGGHSLLAVRLVAAIEDEFGRVIPLAALFADPDGDLEPSSVARLARLVRGRPAPDRGLVPLRRDGVGTPLVCVAAAGGDVAGYAGLAAALGDRPVHGLQAGPERTVAGIAAAHLADLPPRPCLAGWSMGGVIAYELARQLRERGAETGPLLLLDSYLPDQTAGYDERALLLRDAVAEVARAYGTDADELDVPAGTPVGDLADAVLAVLPRAVPAAEQARLRERLGLVQDHLTAARAWRPRPYPGDVVLIQAGEQDPRLRAAAARGWADLTGGRLTTHVVGGDHLGLLRPPHVGELADVVRAVLGAGTDARRIS